MHKLLLLSVAISLATAQCFCPAAQRGISLRAGAVAHHSRPQMYSSRQTRSQSLQMIVSPDESNPPPLLGRGPLPGSKPSSFMKRAEQYNGRIAMVAATFGLIKEFATGESLPLQLLDLLPL